VLPTDPPEPDVFSYDNATELEPMICQLQYCYRTRSKPEPEPDVLSYNNTTEPEPDMFSYDNATELEPTMCLAITILQNQNHDTSKNPE
jgi:hypothetical protein